uniref:Cadherin-like beta sandwich domain-containing protein n=1 Tax=viral metagenome TaxID=1070528 RepID=A0A6H1ZJC3_9ZZZZ
MSDGIAAYGITLNWDGVDVAEITNVSGPGMKVDSLDLTSHGSSDAFREFVAGLADGGEVTFEGHFYSGDTNGMIAFITDMQARSSKTCIVTSPTAAAFTWTFTAFATAFDMQYPHDGTLGFTATVKITGKPVLAVTAATGPTDIVVTGNVSGALAEIPTYAAGTYEYVVNTVAEASVTVTVTAAGANTITVNGNTVASGVASGAIDLTPGAITTLTVVVGETGKVNKTYTIRCMSAGA